MTGCANGGSCVSNEEKQTYSCVCKKPWTGDECEVGEYRYYNALKQEYYSRLFELKLICNGKRTGQNYGFTQLENLNKL